MKSYDKLTEEEKESIVEIYYNEKDKTFLEMSNILQVSERAFSRVLKEKGVNTRIKNRYTLNENYFDIIDTQNKAYILGLIYADGFIGDNKTNNVVIMLKEEDKYLLEKIADEIEFTGNIRNAGKGGYENSGIRYSLNFSSKHMCESLRKLNVTTVKSLTMNKLPNIDKSLMRHFIRGYFDGDGSFCSSHNSSYYNKTNGDSKKYSYKTGTWSLIGTELFLKSLERYLDFHCTYTNSKTEEMKYLSISGKSNLNKLYNFLYKDSDIYLTRKHNKFLDYLSSVA